MTIDQDKKKLDKIYADLIDLEFGAIHLADERTTCVIHDLILLMERLILVLEGEDDDSD